MLRGLRLRHPRPGVHAEQCGDPIAVVQSVRKALTTYEPRIDVLDVNAESPPGADNLLLIRINYRIRANNAIGNLVYPFYIREAA